MHCLVHMHRAIHEALVLYMLFAVLDANHMSFIAIRYPPSLFFPSLTFYRMDATEGLIVEISRMSGEDLLKDQNCFQNCIPYQVFEPLGNSL